MFASTVIKQQWPQWRKANKQVGLHKKDSKAHPDDCSSDIFKIKLANPIKQAKQFTQNVLW